MKSKFSLFKLSVFFIVLAAIPVILRGSDLQEHLDNASRLLANGDFEHAILEYQEALRIKPDSGKAQSWLGISYDRWGDGLLKKGETDRAIEAFKHAVATLPDEPYWHEQLGLAFERKGDRESAKKEFQTAALLSPLDDGLKSSVLGPASGWPDPTVERSGVAKVGKRFGNATHLVRKPVPIHSQEPKYSDRAREAELQGNVVLWIVIDATGKVTEAAVVNPLGLGLDTAALKTVRSWNFCPATSDGTPVPVKVEVEVSFRLD